MFHPKSPHTETALAAITEYLKEGSVGRIRKQAIVPGLHEPRGCFVSVHKQDDSLRGCIGTIEPQYKHLQQEIIANATAAITRDTRFPPVELDELPELVLSVDVLGLPKEIRSSSELDPAHYGVIVSDGVRRGLLLPDLPQVTSIDKQLHIAKKKAGLASMPIEKLQLFRFSVERFH